MRGLFNSCFLFAVIVLGVWALYTVEDETEVIPAPPPAPMPEDDDGSFDVSEVDAPDEADGSEAVDPPDAPDAPDAIDETEPPLPPGEDPPPDPPEVVEAPPRDPPAEPLPGPSDFDEDVWVGVGAASASVGTAFSIGQGVWMTARHVVDGCDQTVLEVQGEGGPTASPPLEPENSEVSIVTSPLERAALALDVAEDARSLGDDAFIIGYPTGLPGEVAGRLMGRATIQLRGRYVVGEPALVWAETSRTEGVEGHLAGLSGGPAFDEDGEVIGVMVAHAPRRGRVYTSAPSQLAAAVADTGAAADPAAEAAGDIAGANFGDVGRRLRRDLQVAKVQCLVGGAGDAEQGAG